MTEAALAPRLDALATRAATIRMAARWLACAALTLLCASAFSFTPDPASNDTFGLYIAVPPELAARLQANGAALAHAPSAYMTAGNRMPWQFSCALPFAILAFVTSKMLIPSRLARVTLVLTSPLWIAGIASHLMPKPSHSAELAARNGVLADRLGKPKVPATGTGKPLVEPFVLRPQEYKPFDADQAHYVLAQQAYTEGDAPGVARQLSEMAGAWQPVSSRDIMRIAVMSRYVEARRLRVGPVAERLAGQWHPRFFRMLTNILLLAALLVGLSALTLELTGRKRDSRSAKLREALVAPPAVDPGSVRSARPFGAKERPLQRGRLAR